MLNKLIDQINDAVYIVDTNTAGFLDFNDVACKMLGYSRKELLNMKVPDICLSITDQNIWDMKLKETKEKGHLIFEGDQRRKDGTKLTVELNIKYISHNESYYLIIAARDITARNNVISKEITQLKHMEEELRTLSITDDLTGIYNRRGFFALAGHRLKLASRMKKGIFMLYADVDGLKEINDSFGHKEGDMALVDIANILKTIYRDSDIVARIGGDEFVVIPVGVEGDSIEMISSRLQKKLEIHNSRSNRRYKLSVSFGIVFYDPQRPCTIDELISQADMLMYEHKRKNKKS
jgi:diguanylate cyclase (GGDEF)-like protein/PAS domain S-box-containing protein